MPKIRLKIIITKQKENNQPTKTSSFHRKTSLFIHEKIKRILDNDILPFIITPLVFIAFASLEWWHWYQEMLTPSPILLSLIALGLSVYCYYKLTAHEKRMENQDDSMGIVSEQ